MLSSSRHDSPPSATAVDAILTLPTLARRFGFASVAVSDLALGDAPEKLVAWLNNGYHGDMGYLEQRANLRANPANLVPEAQSALMLAMPYVPAASLDDGLESAWKQLSHSDQAYVSLYARARDYHKVVRKQLARFAQAIQETYRQAFTFRVFCDSAPVMEVELSRRAGLGWRGKHSLLIDQHAGSLFFLGAILTSVPAAQWQALLGDVNAGTNASANPSNLVRPDGQHCGTCQQCIHVCPTQAIVAPYQVDARRCISYLTIESAAPIPVEFREKIGNRVLGCDDCQLACPWNKFAKSYTLPDFEPREPWGELSLVEAFSWDEPRFLKLTEGSAIRRLSHEQWQRNVAVAMGNALRSLRVEPLHGQTQAATSATVIREALHARLLSPASAMLAEHIHWALAQ